tara:strand:- start:122 stop:280 length:159 start_codon:yes stop_codon:yes gene_type:complete
VLLVLVDLDLTMLLVVEEEVMWALVLEDLVVVEVLVMEQIHQEILHRKGNQD